MTTSSSQAVSELRGHIIIVDDSRTVLASARAALTQAGFQVTTATDPAQLDPSQLHQVDLIFVDVNMEQVFGDDVVSFFRQAWDVSAPIFLYSTLDQSELDRRASAAGATGAISKSRGTQALVEQAEAVLGGHEGESAT